MAVCLRCFSSDSSLILSFYLGPILLGTCKVAQFTFPNTKGTIHPLQCFPKFNVYYSRIDLKSFYVSRVPQKLRLRHSTTSSNHSNINFPEVSSPLNRRRRFGTTPWFLCPRRNWHLDEINFHPIYNGRIRVVTRLGVRDFRVNHFPKTTFLTNFWVVRSLYDNQQKLTSTHPLSTNQSRENIIRIVPNFYIS